MNDPLSLSTLRELYHRDYYLNDCEGFEEFTRGAKLSRRLAKVLELTRSRTGGVILDAGCGRGELAVALARSGARVIALDVSRAALGIATSAPSTARWLQARLESLPLADEIADAVILSDVIEHLPERAQTCALAECRRVLRAGGRLILHTQPNRILMDRTIPALAPFARLWGVALPRDPRAELGEGSSVRYHVREMSLGDVRRALLVAGFVTEESWLEGTYPIHRIFGETRIKRFVLGRFYKSPLLKQLFASQIFAIAVK